MRTGPKQQRRQKHSRTTTAARGRTSGRPTIEPVERRLMMYAPGTLDTSFNVHGVLSIASPSAAQVSSVDVQPDGRVLVAGIYTSGGSSVTLLSRRLSNGQPDPTFAGGGSVSIPTAAVSVNLEYDAKIVVAGSILERLNQDGTPDTTFGTASNGIVTPANPVSALIFQDDGKILTAANVSGRPEITRYNSNGTVDTSYGASGTRSINILGGGAATYTAGGLSLNTAGDALLSLAINGNTGLATFAVARLTTSGSLDQGFGIGGVAEVRGYGLPSRVSSIATAPDGTIYQLGSYNFGQASGHGYLLAYTANGQTASISPNGGLNTFASDVAVGADNKPVIVGTAVTGSGAATHTVITVDRFNAVNAANPVYAPDGTFNGTGLATIAYNPASASDSVSVGDLGWSLRELGNGNLVIGGTSVNPGSSTTSFNVTKLLGDGSTAASVGTITGITYLDNDGSGTRNGLEAGAEGYGVFIDADHSDSLTPGDTRVFTDATGRYTFNNLAPGTYDLIQILTTGFRNTQPATGHTFTVTVGANQTVATGHDFAVAGNASISGIVYSDLNNNGHDDSNEPVLSGYGVYIDANNNGVLDSGDYRVFSDSSGVFTFTNLFPTTYRIRQNTPAGFTRTEPSAFPLLVTVAPGQAATGYNFGLHMTA